MQCIRYVYFQWLLLWLGFVFPTFTPAECATFCTKQSSVFFRFSMPTRMNFISRNQTLSVIWLLTFIFTEFICWCFCFAVLALSFYVERTANWVLELYIDVDCTVQGHLHWIFLCCVCKPRAKLHQNKTNTKRTVHRMYTSYFTRCSSLFSHCQGITFFLVCVFYSLSGTLISIFLI